MLARTSLDRPRNRRSGGGVSTGRARPRRGATDRTAGFRWRAARAGPRRELRGDGAAFGPIPSERLKLAGLSLSWRSDPVRNRRAALARPRRRSWRTGVRASPHPARPHHPLRRRVPHQRCRSVPPGSAGCCTQLRSWLSCMSRRPVLYVLKRFPRLSETFILREAWGSVRQPLERLVRQVPNGLVGVARP
jgi:hypothetical protein